jgi:hypothetical protein
LTLSEKAFHISSMINRGASAFELVNDRIEIFEQELQRALERQKLLLGRRFHARALHLESVRLAKAMVCTSSQARALEFEIEKPFLVHRWKFLDRVNPALTQSIRLIIQQRQTLVQLIVKEGKLKMILARLTARYEKLEHHLQKSHGEACYQEFRYYTEALKQKTKLLSQMERQVARQQMDLSGQKDSLMTVRTLVREEKTEIHETKKIVTKIRAKTALDGRKKKPEPSTARAESRFVGGGFAIGGFQLPDGPVSARPMTPRARPENATQIQAVAEIHTPRRVDQTPKALSARRPGNHAPVRPIAKITIR